MPDEREKLCDLISEYYNVLESVKDLRIGIKQLNNDLMEHSRQELRKEAALYQANGDVELCNLLEYMASSKHLKIYWPPYDEFTKGLRCALGRHMEGPQREALLLELKQWNSDYEELMARLKKNRLFSSQHPDYMFEVKNIKRYSHFTGNHDIHDFYVDDVRRLSENMLDKFPQDRRNEDCVFQLVNSTLDIPMDQLVSRIRKCIDEQSEVYLHQRQIINDEMQKRYGKIGRPNSWK